MRARILVVDTESTARALAQQVATSRPNWELTSAQSAEQALERCSSAAFDLMLIAEALPDRSGIDLVMDVRSFDPWTGIAMLRSGDDAHETVELLRLGVDIYLERPFLDLPAIVLELSGLIDESRRRRGATQQGFIPTRSLPPPIAAGASARIAALVVSPLRSEREWVGRQLEERANVRELATSSAALAIIELAPVDLLVVDADVRDPDAFDLIAAVNELIVGIRCVVVAGSFTPSEVKRYTELGVTALLKKPLEATDFAARIARVLRIGRGSSLPAPPASIRSSA